MSAIGPVVGSATAGFSTNPHTTPSRRQERNSGGDDEQHRRPQNWHDALAELEGEVLDAEQTLGRGHATEIAAWGRRSDDWIPPIDLGPLPDDLRERAMQLLQHQLAVAEALVERITQSQKQRDVAARMSYSPDRPVPAYIDRAL